MERLPRRSAGTGLRGRVCCRVRDVVLFGTRRRHEKLAAQGWDGRALSGPVAEVVRRGVLFFVVVALCAVVRGLLFEPVRVMSVGGSDWHSGPVGESDREKAKGRRCNHLQASW